MSSLQDARDVARGAAYTSFGFGGRLIARAILMIIAGRAYGVEALGVLGQVAAIVEVAAAIGVLGLKRGLLDTLSYETEKGGRAEPRIIEALIVAMLFGFVISVCLLVVWPYVLPAEPTLIVILFFTIPAIVFTEVALAAVKFMRIIKWDILARAVLEPWGFLLLATIFVLTDWVSNGLIVAYLFSNILAAVCAGLGLLRCYSLSALLTAKPSISTMLLVPQKSVPIGVTDIGVLMLRRIDIIVLGAIAGPQAAGLYYMVQQLATVPQKINALFEPMLSPVIAQLHNRADVKKIHTHLAGVCRWILIIQLAISVPMIVFGDYLLSIFGSDFAVGMIALAIILIAELIDGSFLPVDTPLLFAKPKIPPLLLILTFVIEIALIAIFSSMWGIEGAALGFLIAVMFLTAGRLFMLKKHFGINLINGKYFQPVLFAACIAALLAVVRNWIEPDQITLIVVFSLAGLAGFVFLVRSFALSRADRTVLRALSRGRRRHIFGA